MLDFSITGDMPVKHIVSAITLAHAANCPVILRRDTHVPLPKNLPSHFCIGLQTSGTTGKPKLVFHSLDKLLPVKALAADTRWLLCYHPMSFAGLQVILQALFSGALLISAANSSAAEKAALAADARVNAMGITPSLFRAMTLSWQDNLPPLTQLTFGGEICDDATLALASKMFPAARIRHIYATTEAGVVFSVRDGQAGFPASWLGHPLAGGKILSIVDDILWVSHGGITLNTGDRVSLQGDRIVFNGRNDNIANVGGVKVDLEALEQTIIALASVTDARVFARSNPITGHLICLEYLAPNESDASAEIAAFCQGLVPEMRPRIIRRVTEITLTDAGKKQRIGQ
ncbi:AMP-binding protein [Shewanella sp. FJAT-52076]|uniref:AMP-binding protein n=1 Tax=Shewanella sp. FJAT-52076 TaxID=2864202 RepID=UPI001C65FE3F|nr:AMP-binding protein [Shewanella sp. FJAT-52076]QYJ74130.1 AMP-binding protein [Shewanella sp. FJAT-52076]